MNEIYNEEPRKRTVAHISSLVLGIISVIGATFWYMALPCGILAIVFGAKSVRDWGSGAGKAGLVLGIVGLSLCVFLYFTIISIALLNI